MKSMSSGTRSPHASATRSPANAPQQDRAAHTFRHGVVQRPDLFRAGEVGPLFPGAGRRAARARRPGDDPVVHRVGHDLRQAGMQRVDVGGLQRLGTQPRRPRADVRRPDRRQQHGPELGHDLRDVDCACRTVEARRVAYPVSHVSHHSVTVVRAVFGLT
jgi:hypothetical protein